MTSRFQWDGDRFSVTDVGSLNGTYVNGQRAAAQTLATGSEVQIGKFRLVVFLSGKSG
jgi:pSer/pThr/pTyr-binding forkhead associated (FHA) protein